MLLQKGNISQKNISNRSGSSIDPLWNTNYNIQLFISFTDSIEEPYAWSFATIRSCGRQSKQWGKQCGLLFRNHIEILITQFQSILRFVYAWIFQKCLKCYVIQTRRNRRAGGEAAVPPDFSWSWPFTNWWW